MRTRTACASERRAGGRRRVRAALLLAGVLVTGCLGEPELEDRWTRIDLDETSLESGQEIATGTPTSVRCTGAVTFRSVLTGFLVTEVRVSSSMTSDAVGLDPDGPRLDMAHDVDDILASSVTAGRAVRAMTGWDHLIFPFDLTFDATVPAVSDSGATVGAFLVTYMGEGEEIELENGSDSLVVTPFPSEDYQILPIGLPLAPSTGARAW